MTIKKGFIGTLFLSIVILTGITGILGYSAKQGDRALDYEISKVDLNEIIQLSKACGREQAEQQTGQGTTAASENEEKLEQAVGIFQQNLNKNAAAGDYDSSVNRFFILYGMGVVLLILIYYYLYVTIIRPFIGLEKYAAEIAKGNLQIVLPYGRTNYFGAFTWAFDHMRKEIIKARACEKEAIDNNKTVIATLSHDIKTPIASIRAYAEALDANLDTSQEKRRQYSAVIMRKCDEVTKLTNDLFLHSLSDLNRLKMNLENVRIKELLEEIISGLQREEEDITISGMIPDVIVKTDRRRFEQVIENLVNNSRKYADSSITVSAAAIENKLRISIRDYGEGIPDENLPFIFQKFYRGANCGDQPGSGLGLYIVKYIMEQTEGEVSLKNTDRGLEVTLVLEQAVLQTS